MRRLPPGMRIRIRAVLRLADEALQSLDAYIAAVLDVRSLRSVACEVAERWGRRWRRHREDARIREYGPGRGLLAVIITRPAHDKEHK